MCWITESGICSHFLFNSDLTPDEQVFLYIKK